MDTIDVGKQISKFRKEKGYSMRELSRITAITTSMLSQIERGLANPSLQTLKTLSKALDVPMFYFFLEESKTDDLIVRRTNRRKMIAGDVVYELLSPDLSGDIETMIMTVPKGMETSNEPIGHKGEEIAVVMEGSVQLNLDGIEHTLEQGDSVKIPAFMKHRWKNTSDKDIKVIFSVTPAVF